MQKPANTQGASLSPPPQCPLLLAHDTATFSCLTSSSEAAELGHKHAFVHGILLCFALLWPWSQHVETHGNFLQHTMTSWTSRSVSEQFSEGLSEPALTGELLQVKAWDLLHTRWPLTFSGHTGFL